MRTSSFTANTAAYASDMNDLRSDAYGSSQLNAHQESTPGMTVYVEKGVFFLGPTKVSFAGGSSPTITAPTANPRIDLLTIDSSGTLALITGTEAASPTAPTAPSDKMVLAQIYNVVGETIIYDNENQTAGQGYLTDVRPILSNPAPSVAASSNVKSTVYQNTSGRYEIHLVSVGVTVGPTTSGTARFQLLCDATSTPVTVVAEMLLQGTTTSTLTQEGQLTMIVPPGYYYQLYPYTSGTGTTYASTNAWQVITL